MINNNSPSGVGGFSVWLITGSQHLYGEETLKKVEEGKVDIIIGTHGLLANTVKFKDLGLMIIDEEQKFGVAHKEKLKTLKATVDCLTLTATPIPRTSTAARCN